MLTYKAETPGRLSDILRRDMKISTGLMNKLKWQQRLLVNGCPQHTDFQVKKGDIIQVLLEEVAPQYPAEPGELTVLYEDDHMLAVDKPAGMLIHPSRSTNKGTLANRVLWYYQTTGQSCAFHPVTRLDRDTFGVVLLAKNPHIHALLQQVDLTKEYRALVYGCPKEDQGEISAPIARRPLPSLLRYVDESGKKSLTRYQLLSRDASTARLALWPITGRTHQLRIHCSYFGHPILGDPQYFSLESNALSQALGLKTQALCAKKLSFLHPITGEDITITSAMDV